MQYNSKQITQGWQSQAGFTLIELMVALILGGLIAAAALQILLTSSRNEASQKAASQIQDDGTFGLQMMKRQILLANLGARTFKETETSTTFNTQYSVTDRTRQGGIVITAPELDSGVAKDKFNLAKLKYKDAQIPKSVLSHDGSSPDLPNAQKASNLVDPIDSSTVINSDQLTIQYQAPYDMTNCEGVNVRVGQYVIERYFVRANGSDTALACAAAIYDYPSTAADTDIQTYNIDAAGTKKGTNDLTSDGTVILPRVESFQVQLGVSDSSHFATEPANLTVRYMTISDYRDLPDTPKPRIISIKTAVLVRSANNPGAGPSATEFSKDLDLLNEKVKLKPDSDNQLRNVYTTTALIRNGRGNS